MDSKKTAVIRHIGKRGRGKGQFISPCGIVVTLTGDIAVVDTENHRIQIFHENGSFKSKFGSKGCKVDQFNYPLCIAVTSQNHLAVTDSVNACVKVFSEDGQLVQLCGGEFDFPYGIAVSFDGFFIVTDIFKHSVTILDSEGSPHHSFGEFGSGLKEFDHPYFVAVDQSKQIIVSDSGNSSIKLFHFDGKLLRMFSQNDFKLLNETFFNLQGLCLDADGNTLVICNSTIYILIKNGRLWEILTTTDGLFCPKSLSYSPAGCLVVTQCDKRHEVTVFRYKKEDFKSLNSAQFYAISL
ncbi:E3 ubiquitin-protein ligase TRIM71-like [Saccostrea echinata]|uniref:E3 ubiquitin-protein ligase TRIM71-like n=1 Tax=Saccostrea echinata TaxID=191078 RepID=UPI002A83C32F|nr:E3 ubiquitin-protein ligase TRIM71-like [Saccostrea echinata]XP_061175926.1 E3 ubiquitin-protein ligase TRIM71-like [Saccostrea echinata]